MDDQEIMVLTSAEFIRALQGQDDRFITNRRQFMHGPVLKSIVFNNITVNESIIITDAQAYAQYPVFIMDNAIFNNYFCISAGNFLNEISIEGGIFCDGFTIRGGIFNDSISISDGEFHKLCDFTEGIFKASLNIIGGYFWNCTIAGIECALWLNIQGGFFKKLSFAGKPKIERSINISGGYFHELFFRIETANLIKIEGDNDRFLINILDISGLLIKENLFFFQDIKLSTIKFNNLINNGQIYFTGVAATVGFEFKPDKLKVNFPEDNRENLGGLPKFELNNSDLGKTTFIDCDLSEFALAFRSSKINEVFLAGTRWFLPDKINSESGTDYEQDKLILSQTRKIHENLGDALSAIEYYSREMNIRLLHLQAKHINKAEQLQLTLNKWSNNHGENWVRALLVLVASGSLFYSIYCILLTGFSVNFSHSGFKEFFRRTSYFLEFINPLHKADFLAERITFVKNFSPSGIVIFLDGLSRIIFAYLIYQFIQAFRKHGRKGSV